MKAITSFGLSLFFLSLAGFIESACFSLSERILNTHIHIDFLLMIVVFMALKRGSLAGILTGFFAGALQDAVQGQELGIHILVMTTVGYVAAYFHTRVFVDDIISSLVAIIVALLTKYLLITVLLWIIDVSALANLYSINLLYGALLTLLFTPIFYWLLSFITKAVPKRY